MANNTFVLVPIPPFRLDLTVWTLRRRAHNAIDRWDGQTYRRILPLEFGPVEMSVTQIGPSDAPKLRILVDGQPLRASVKAAVTSALRRLLGLNIDLTAFYRFAARDRQLGDLSRRFRGMKPPRFGSVFEGVVNAMACQQLTLTVGIELLNRLARACGREVGAGTGTAQAFPLPRDVAVQSTSSLRALGFSQQKGRAMIELSRSITEGEIDLEELEHLPSEKVVARLMKLRGVGRWTAEYVLLRGLGRVDVFPGDDIGCRNNLQRWIGVRGPLDYDGVHRALDRWRPFGGMIYFHLLLDNLAKTQTFSDAGGVSMIHLKRAYETASSTDGERILVERLWPRGLTKAKAAVDLWLKDIAPSAELRKWFGHDPARWKQFQQRYWKELQKNPEAVDELRSRVKKGHVTLIYAAHDEEHNGALALKDFLERDK